jgi:hypothetical protein
MKKIASPGWKRRFGTSVHLMAVQVCLLEMGWWAEANRPNEKFQYFMESGDEDEKIVRKVVSDMRGDSATANVIRVNSFSVRDKGSERGTWSGSRRPNGVALEQVLHEQNAGR